MFEMLHDHQPDLLGWIASSCGAQLEAERYWFRGAPVILTGPRGCGRTHAARWLARVSGVPHVILNLSDPIIASNLAASHAVGETLWASPVTVAMATTRCANPVVTVLGAEFASDDVTNGFLSMIDPELGAVWREDLLGVQVDLSEVTWVFQAGEPMSFPPAILDLASHVKLREPPLLHSSFLALSILLEAMGDLRLDKSVVPNWAQFLKQLRLTNSPSAQSIYDAMVSELLALARNAPGAVSDFPF